MAVPACRSLCNWLLKIKWTTIQKQLEVCVTIAHIEQSHTAELYSHGRPEDGTLLTYQLHVQEFHA